MCLCVDRALCWNGDVRAIPKCECLEESYVIITIMVMSVLWFSEGWNKIMNPSISWVRPWNPNMWILCCGSPTLWDILLTYWKMFYFCSNGGHAFQVFHWREKKNKPLDSFWVELPACCHAGVDVSSWFSWLCSILDDSAVCAHYITLPANQETFCERVVSHCFDSLR